MQGGLNETGGHGIGACPQRLERFVGGATKLRAVGGHRYTIEALHRAHPHSHLIRDEPAALRAYIAVVARGDGHDAIGGKGVLTEDGLLFHVSLVTDQKPLRGIPC